MNAELEVLQKRVVDHYARKEYREALDLCDSVRDRYPASAGYWNACLLAVTGGHAQALETLEGALERGCWWSPLALRRDPDFEAVRGDDRFTRVLEASEARWRANFRDEPEISMLPPQGTPTGVLLIALHGSHRFSLEGFVEQWEPLTSLGIALAVPFSTQRANSDGGATWDDRTRMERDVRLTYERASSRFDTSRLVVGGFSAGGLAAITTTITGRAPLVPLGFIAVGAVVGPEVVDALDRVDRSLRGWIVVGDEDWARDGCVALAERAHDLGLPWRIEVVPDVGHRIPDDFTTRSRRAMEFLLSP